MQLFFDTRFYDLFLLSFCSITLILSHFRMKFRVMFFRYFSFLKFISKLFVFNFLSLNFFFDFCKSISETFEYFKIDFVLLPQDSLFRQEIEQSPELGLLILDAMQEEESNKSISKLQNYKRRRVSENVSSSQHELVLVPNQAGDANTISGNIQEQW